MAFIRSLSAQKAQSYMFDRVLNTPLVSNYGTVKFRVNSRTETYEEWV